MGHGAVSARFDHREAVRLHAVQAVAAGEKKSAVARRCGVSRQALHGWTTRHRAGGAAALADKRPGRGQRRLLEPWQEAQVAGTILLLSPRQVSQPYSCWTKKAIAGFVEQRFGLRLSEWMVGSYLRRWGFRTLKDARRAFQRTPPGLGSLLSASAAGSGSHAGLEGFFPRSAWGSLGIQDHDAPANGDWKPSAGMNAARFVNPHHESSHI